MANLTINLPQQTGEVEHDFNELFSWANRLVAELRTLIHTLDSSNIRSLSAEKLAGVISAARIGGTAHGIFIDAEGVSITDEDADADARIYMAGGSLRIDAPHVYINGQEVPAND